MQKRSLGLIETWGHIPAIEAADAGCKAANVLLAGYEEVRAGLVTIMFVGDVAAVKTAVSAGAAAAAKVGKIVSCHVIARPDPQLDSLPTLPKPPPVTPSRRSPPAPAGSDPPTDKQTASGEEPMPSPQVTTTQAPRTRTGGGAGKRSKRPPKA